MNQSNDKPNVIVDLWEILLRHRWRFILPAFLVTVTVLTVSLFLPRKYAARAIFERRTDMVLAEISSQHVAQSFQDPRHMLHEDVAGVAAIDAMLQQIMPTLHEKGWVTGEAELRDLRENLIRRIVIHTEVETPTLDRIRVDYIAFNPELAQLVCNTLVQNYIARTREMMDSRLLQATTFFRDEMNKSRARIESVESKMLEFEVKHASLLPTNLDVVQTQQGELESQLAELDSEREAADSRVKALEQTLAKEPESTPTYVRAKNPDLVRLETKRRDMLDLMDKYQKIMRMTDRHPDVIALREQIAEIDRQIAGTDDQVITQTQIVVNPRRSDLELKLSTAQSEWQALNSHTNWLTRQIDKIKSETADVFAVRGAYRKLEQQRDEARRQLQFWEQNLHKVEMALTVESGNRGIQLNFVQPARLRPTPVSPLFAQVLLGSMGLGMLCGILSVFFAHRSDEAFADGQELANAMELPLFGAVSELITSRHRRIRTFRNLILYPTHAFAMTVVIAALVLLLHRELEEHPTPAAGLESASMQIDPAMQPTRILATVEIEPETSE